MAMKVALLALRGIGTTKKSRHVKLPDDLNLLTGANIRGDDIVDRNCITSILSENVLVQA